MKAFVKCPHCLNGRMFYESNKYGHDRIPYMSCVNCGHTDYLRESSTARLPTGKVMGRNPGPMLKARVKAKA